VSLLPKLNAASFATSHHLYTDTSPLHQHPAHQYQRLYNTAPMVDTQGTRRSGRARKTVTTYAEQQAKQQSADAATLVKRKKPAIKAAKSNSKGAPTDPASLKSGPGDGEDLEPPRKKIKKEQPTGEEDNTAQDFDFEASQDDEDFKPAPKKARKKRTVPIGKLDSEGVMRLDTTEPRPKGERKPARVYEIPSKPNSEKGKSTINLAAILAETFEDRWERKVSKIPRLAPGAPEVRLKE
jgi:hypothetical protein